MENEVLQQILVELKDLKAGQSKLEAGQVRLEIAQAKTAEDVTHIRDAVAVLEQGYDRLFKAFDDSRAISDEELSDIRLRLRRLEQAK